MPITAETLAALRGVANTIITNDLKTEVTVLHRTRDPDPDSNPYGSSEESWVEQAETYLAWVREVRATDLANLNRTAGLTTELEVRFPINAIAEPGDRLVIGGDLWVVNATDNMDTLPIFLKVTARRIE